MHFFLHLCPFAPRLFTFPKGSISQPLIPSRLLTGLSNFKTISSTRTWQPSCPTNAPAGWKVATGWSSKKAGSWKVEKNSTRILWRWRHFGCPSLKVLLRQAESPISLPDNLFKLHEFLKNKQIHQVFKHKKKRGRFQITFPSPRNSTTNHEPPPTLRLGGRKPQPTLNDPRSFNQPSTNPLLPLLLSPRA